MLSFPRACEPRLRALGSTIVVFAIAMLCSACSSAPRHGWTPLQASTGLIDNPVQLFSEDTDVYGLKVNLPYGKNTNMYGTDVGFASSVEKMNGLQFNLFGNEAKDFNGIRMSLIPGNNAVNVNGIELAFSNTVEERVIGYQQAVFVNEAGDLFGMQIAGLFNKAGRTAGLQITPLVNDAESLAGLQIGLINIARESLAGLQIGILNFNKNGLLPIFPIVNFDFRGASEESTTSED